MPQPEAATMIRPALLLFLLASACGSSAPPADGGNTLATGGAGGSAPAAPVAAAAPTDLTGLYEKKGGETANQLCMIAKGPDKARFGLVVWGSNLHSCSGAGEAVRTGDRLVLTMTGDSACRIEARLSDGIVTFTAPPPAGCSYYCGARARLDGASFTRVGATKDDALKAKDLAGDSLCAGVG
jgi:hypothetical protein